MSYFKGKQFNKDIILQQNLKRRFAKSSGFQSIRHAPHTLKGLETVQALYKRKSEICNNQTSLFRRIMNCRYNLPLLTTQKYLNAFYFGNFYDKTLYVVPMRIAGLPIE